MPDAIDELVDRSKPCSEMCNFHDFHKRHPEVLDFLVEEIFLRLERFDAFSYYNLWQYARWKLEMEKGPQDTFLMNDHLTPFYSRAITILHPEFNGHAEFRKSKVDLCFGTQIEPAPEKRSKNYARRLQWADGQPIEVGWRPSIPHKIKHSGTRRPDIHVKKANVSVRRVPTKKAKRHGT